MSTKRASLCGTTAFSTIRAIPPASSLPRATITSFQEGGALNKFDIGKSALPDFQGGLNIALRLYGFDLSIATAFQIGGYVYDGEFAGTMSSGFYGGHNRELWNTWNPETMSGEYGIWNNQSQKQLVYSVFRPLPYVGFLFQHP